MCIYGCVLFYLQDVSKGILDMSLFLKLQKRVSELEQEKQSLQNELDRREEQFQRARARVHTHTHTHTHTHLLYTHIYIVSVYFLNEDVPSVLFEVKYKDSS